jgi:CDP-diacylglycerol--glycerol-3-phosphate 3-phosphatidyltransferase
LSAIPENRSIKTWVKCSSLIKILLMPFVIHRLFLGQHYAGLIVIAVITFLALLERLASDLPSRVFSALTNRIALIPVLVSLGIQEIALYPKFPILMVLGSTFIILKELFFIRHGYEYLFKQEEYIARRKIQKINAAALVIVVVLYTLRWEPYNNLAMIGVIVISIIDIFAFFWRLLRKTRGMKEVNLATRITLMRLLMSPVFLIVYFYDRNPDFTDNSLLLQMTAVLLSIFFVVTDGLDGYFARKRNEVTKLGKYLDPFSDKICTMTIFLCFVASNYVPVWMVALVFYRESAVDVIRTLAAAENVVISARTSGKWKTALQGTAIITILVLATVLSELSRSTFPSVSPALYADLLIIWSYIPFSLMALVTLVTFLSGLDYVLSSQEILQKYFR